MQTNINNMRVAKTCLMGMIFSLGNLSGSLPGDEPIDDPIDVPVEGLIEDYSVEQYRLQSNSDLYVHEYGEDDRGHTIYYRCQDMIDDYLYLGANEVFFSPVGALTVGGSQANPTEIGKLNKGREYTVIKNVGAVGNLMEWPFITENQGSIRADVFLYEASRAAGTVLEIQVDDKDPIQVTFTKETEANGYISVDLPQLENGIHMLRMGTKKAGRSNYKVFNCRLSGDGVSGARIVRERWRPSSVRAAFSSSENPEDVQAWIMEQSSDSTFQHYSPMTTNFGYFGPAFLPGGAVQNVNMSIWSYGRKERPLPYNQRAHLLGIGSNQGYFSGWSHEGFGVKVRGWNIFEDNTSKKHVIGLRYKVDGDFVTFYGYFWNEVTEKWQLFSVGRKQDKKGTERLKMKTFVEVAGHSSGKRCNQAERRVRYRGWIRDSSGNWTDADQMQTGDDPEYLSNKEKGISEDGETFYVKTGGLINQYPINQGIMQKKKVEDLPLYMTPEKLKAFDEIPFVPEITNVTLGDDDQMTVELKTNSEQASKVTLCWGPVNAQSNKELWENTKKFKIKAGDHDRVDSISVPKTDDARFFRILVQNDNAQMWNFDSFDLYPELVDPEDARPFEPHIEGVSFDGEGNMTVSYIRGTKYASQMIIAWGSTDGGEDISSWENVHSFDINGIKHRKKYTQVYSETLPVLGDTSVFRIFIGNEEEGQVWSELPYSPDDQ